MHIFNFKLNRILVLLLSAGASAIVQAEDRVTLHYYERPPFAVKRDTGATGLTADAAREAFERAGVPFDWAVTPAKRQLALFEQNTGLDCGVGWLKNKEREAYGRFSKTIYQDKPTIVLARPDFKPSGDTLVKVLANPNLNIVMKNGLTYGQYVIQQVGTAKARIQSASVEQPVIARMISSGRGDFMFSTQEEAEMLVTGDESGPNSLKVFTFPDIPVGETRHILCSKKVSDATMAKLNAAIDQMTKAGAKRK